uniref:Uncharacterized protein n=1 Tax=Manihot esculenta TaxID=3983 RepID=A0A2C9W5B3_MANES
MHHISILNVQSVASQYNDGRNSCHLNWSFSSFFPMFGI